MIGSLLITGTVRNVGKDITKRVLKLENELKHLFTTKWLIVESDSDDNTVTQLLKLKGAIPKFEFITLGQLRDRIILRTERLAFCRNVYLSEINNSSNYKDIEYIMVIDLDGVNDYLTKESVSTCFERNDWDVCCACQKGPYYDVWALRHPLWSPNDCWQTYEFLLSHGSSKYMAATSAVYSRMLNLSKLNHWIEVDSAFGGCAIYKKEVLIGTSYYGITEDKQEICEHVALHQQIKQKGGRIFINPRFINAGIVEHARYATRLGALKFWLKCQLTELIKFLLSYTSR